ncbi:hypothetical protein HOG48_04060 [Candidatus Peregrinibacteria bacterium]|nr:hypothetical protein [Candidatus Peregrinibacteria bacterium]
MKRLASGRCAVGCLLGKRRGDLSVSCSGSTERVADCQFDTMFKDSPVEENLSVVFDITPDFVDGIVTELNEATPYHPEFLIAMENRLHFSPTAEKDEDGIPIIPLRWQKVDEDTASMVLRNIFPAGTDGLDTIVVEDVTPLRSQELVIPSYKAVFVFLKKLEISIIANLCPLGMQPIRYSKKSDGTGFIVFVRNSFDF